MQSLILDCLIQNELLVLTLNIRKWEGKSNDPFRLLNAELSASYEVHKFFLMELNSLLLAEPLYIYYE